MAAGREEVGAGWEGEGWGVQAGSYGAVAGTWGREVRHSECGHSSVTTMSGARRVLDLLGDRFVNCVNMRPQDRAPETGIK